MFATRFFALFAFVALAYSQDQLLDGFQDIRFIDSFEKNTDSLIIVVPESPSFPISVERTVIGDGSDNILGNERNLRLIALSGTTDSVIASGVVGDEFNSATPGKASSVSLLQYDGVDGTADLNPSGLFNVDNFSTDLTIRGGYAIHAVMETDIITDVIFRIYSGSATDYCQFVQILPGDDLLHDYILPFEQFEAIGTGCQFTNVGAFEIVVEMFENVDILIETVTTYGPIPVTPTPTATKTRSPTPIATPSPSVTRTVTPTPLIGCICRCPIFTCEVIRVDDAYAYYYPTGGYFFFDSFFTFFDPGFFYSFFGFFQRFFIVWYY